MSKLIAILTAVTLLVHVLVGCCDHHAHGVARTTSPDLQETSVSVHDCCCGHGHQDVKEPDQESQLPSPDNCHDSSCVVVSAPSIVVPAPAQHASPGWMKPASESAIELARSNLLSDSNPWLALPLTLFDLHQILLI